MRISRAVVGFQIKDRLHGLLAVGVEIEVGGGRRWEKKETESEYRIQNTEDGMRIGCVSKS